MVRTYLAGFLAAVLSVYAPAVAPARAADAPRLVLLGTAGGPTPKKSRAAPAQAIQVGDRIYVVDCGNGVARQLVLAGLPLKQIRHVFLTHHHSDHAADVVTLPLLALAGGLEQTITIHGPRPLARTVRAGLRQFAPDIEVRREDEGRPDLRRLITVREVKKEGVVLTDGSVTVRAVRAAHPPLDESFAYRFDVVVEGDKDGWSVVISGDTAPSDAVVQLARGADVLVHEVLLLPGLEEVARWLGRPADHPLVHHVVRSHTAVRDVGRIARDAGVRTLVLSHYVPGDAEIDEAAVRAQIGETFEGEIVLGTDLQEFRPGSPDSAR